ncbi:hypothetical protein PC129_g4107 [Phytophthora cactorum]|uniref:Crinkler effector protein N-terminal domain-containing protein n=1 Tax=Phytophthora cactorum TaxID=29920 RepID=A0A8T1INS2_9STRA|nr:hypothetical protein Pcac1_g13691 [Phytophthora cactorum]KAG2830285.1 hypothetical protein PC111_g7447 [Phytophthora cactorum]KAG2834493.1 hypothetical protein PC112_g6057 [Phytophthora cactorum]KAG2862579.1 hypothetical protein PC113_g6183 [Phytophthora cactorum]KAG2919486.1 hypothetical protein PC114_g6460 [Phytophthora cactorum]
MLKISCAIGGAAGSAFLVYMDVDQSVGDLKDAIKKKNVATITCDAKDIKFFLAKKKDGNWLTENKVLRGESDTDGRPYLRVARAELALAGLSEDEVRVQVGTRVVPLATALCTCWRGFRNSVCQ